MGPHYFNFLPFFIPLLFAILSIVISGIFIWIGLKVIGRERGLIRSSIANLAAFVFASTVAVILHFTPLVVFLPLIVFLIYLYILKVLLDIGFIEALAATIIATLVVFIAAFILMVIFGIWLLFTPFTHPQHMINVKF